MFPTRFFNLRAFARRYFPRLPVAAQGRRSIIRLQARSTRHVALRGTVGPIRLAATSTRHLALRANWD